MLANVFLHYVLDDWFVRDVQPRMKGRTFLIRFADDFVIGFELEEDAHKVMEVLPKRFNRFKLTLHPEKTRLVAFQPPNGQNAREGETFDFLSFTHYWAKSRRGYWVIKRQTAGKRLRKAKRVLWEWSRNNRHEPARDLVKTLAAKLRGHYQYFGVRSNYRAMENLYNHAMHSVHYWLCRRSQKSYIKWDSYVLWWNGWHFPRPRIIHQI